MPRTLSPEELARYRARPSALLDRPSYLSDRDQEVIACAEGYRLHVFSNNSDRAERAVTTLDELRAAYDALNGLERGRLLVYAVMGDRQALIPRDRLLPLLGRSR